MGRKSKLTPQDWAKVQVRYEIGDRVEDIAQQFGVSPSAIRNKASREGWIRKKAVRRAVKRATDKIEKEVAENHGDRIKEYINGNVGRINQLYESWDHLSYTFKIRAQKAALDTSRAIQEAEAANQQAIEEAKREYEEALAKERDRVKIEGGAPRPVAYPQPKLVQPKFPTVGKLPYQHNRVTASLKALDTIHRRILGLDGGSDPAQFENDPFQKWMDELQKAHEEFGMPPAPAPE